MGRFGNARRAGGGLASWARLPVWAGGGRVGALGSVFGGQRPGWFGGVPLEYWFFRTSWAAGALLVDVISRRGEGTVELRVSSWHEGSAQVHRIRKERPATAVFDPCAVVDCELTLQSSRGSCGPISWDLNFAVGSTCQSAPPAPWRQLGAFDLSLTSWPLAAATGSVTINGRTHELVGRPSMLCHYWGRQLPRRWLWLSANDFDRPDVAVEAAVLSSRVWGRRVPLPPLDYAWLRDRTDTRMVASPMDGLLRYAPRPTGGVNLSITGLTGRWQLQAWAAGESSVHLGDGIAQTLHADCLLINGSQSGAAHGTAILEVRDEAWATAGPPTADPSRQFANSKRLRSRTRHDRHAAS